MAQSKRTWIIAALIAVFATLVGVAVWWTQRSEDENSGDALANGKKVDRGEVLQRKRQARADAEQLERVGVGGRVTRADDGSGIAGAVVLLSRKDMVPGQAPRPGEPTLPLSTITDANGGWQFDAVDPGRYRVSATAVGFIPVTKEVRIAGRETGINLAMNLGGALLSGTISDIGGGPIEGVLVRINDTSQINLGFNQVPMAAISDENGEYRVQLATGSYSITTFHTDYVAEARSTDVPKGGRREDFQLIPGGTIEGVVLARPDGHQGHPGRLGPQGRTRQLADADASGNLGQAPAPAGHRSGGRGAQRGGRRRCDHALVGLLGRGWWCRRASWR